MPFAVRHEVMDKLMRSKEWVKRLEGCKTTTEVQELVEQFCKEKGFKVEKVNP